LAGLFFSVTALLKGFTIAIAFPLNVFLRTFETLLPLEEAEDLVDLLSESESESVFGLHLVGSLIGSGDLTSESELISLNFVVVVVSSDDVSSGFDKFVSDGDSADLSLLDPERLSGLFKLSTFVRVAATGDFKLDFLLLSIFFSEEFLLFCGDSEDTLLFALGFNFPLCNHYPTIKL